MGMAYVASQRGTCNRLRVGAVIALESRPVSMGYNGAPSGQDHCGSDCDESKPCLNTLHAEENAIQWALLFLGPFSSLRGATIYTTHSPCLECAEKIFKSGISRVVFSEEYRNPTGVYFLRDKGVEVVQCQVSLAISAN